MIEIFAKTIPIFVTIGLGIYFRKTNFISTDTIEEMKKLIIQLCLSAVLFLSFYNMELKSEYFILSFVVVILFISMFFIGKLLKNINFFNHKMLPFVTTSCTFGLLGIPLYTTVYGIENLGYLSVFGIGHEVFVWLIFYVHMKLHFANEKFSTDTILGFLKSPMIISILLGLSFNATGFKNLLDSNSIATGLIASVEMISKITTPMILITIGYNLKFDIGYTRQSLIFILARFVVMFVVGYAFKILLIDKIIETNPLIDMAYFTLLVIPPPSSLPLFVSEYISKKDGELVNNMVVINTIISIFIFVVAVVINPFGI